MLHECTKCNGSQTLVRGNTFLPKEYGGEIATEIELIRSIEEEMGQQIANVKCYGEERNALASDSLKVLQVTARDRAQYVQAADRCGEVQLAGADFGCQV